MNTFNHNGLPNDILSSDIVGERRLKTTSSQNALGIDAWGRNKVVIDHSLFHGLFTYDVPYARWKEMHGTGNNIATMVEQTSFVNGNSIRGMLNVSSGTTSGDIKVITSKSHPRYQPNKGHLYSTALNIPFPTRLGTARFGLHNKDNGVYFETIGDGTDYTLNACVRRDGVVVETVDITSNLPAGFDISKGHVYDIQMQWRGVGNFKFFIDLALIHTFEFLGTLDYLSTSNPALPVSFSTISSGEDYQINVGCVDVTSEGGVVERRTYASVTTDGMVSSGNTPTAMLAYKIPDSYNGKVFTRDSILTRMTTFCKDEAMHSLYLGRAVSNPTVAGLTWDSHLSSLNESLIGGNGTALDNAFTADIAGFALVYQARQEKDFTKVTNSPTGTEFTLTSGDIVIVSIQSDNASTAGATLEFNVEI